MEKKRTSSSLEKLVLELEDAQELQKLGWKYPTILSWYKAREPYVDRTDNSSADVLAPAPTESELFNALPDKYLGFHLVVSKWKSDKPGNHTRYNVGYWNNDANNYEFLSSSPINSTGKERLIDIMASMWAWLNGPNPPEKS